MITVVNIGLTIGIPLIAFILGVIFSNFIKKQLKKIGDKIKGL